MMGVRENHAVGGIVLQLFGYLKPSLSAQQLFARGRWGCDGLEHLCIATTPMYLKKI